MFAWQSLNIKMELKEYPSSKYYKRKRWWSSSWFTRDEVFKPNDVEKVFENIRVIRMYNTSSKLYETNNPNRVKIIESIIK